jgi:hypothetical protein
MRPDGLGLTCYGCGSQYLAVKDSRPTKNAVRRRRRCIGCGLRFTTFEIMSPTQDDTHRLYEALHFYDALLTMPLAQRNAILGVMAAFTPEHIDQRDIPQIGNQRPSPASQMALDAALPFDDEETPRA